MDLSRDPFRRAAWLNLEGFLRVTRRSRRVAFTSLARRWAEAPPDYTQALVPPVSSDRPEIKPAGRS